MTSAIDLFEHCVSGDVDSPPQYVRWSAIALISAMMGRQCYTTLRSDNAIDHVYGNLFVLLVGSAAAGKTDCIKHARALALAEECGLKSVLLPDDITPQKFIAHVKSDDSSESFQRGSVVALLDELSHLIRREAVEDVFRYLSIFYDTRPHDFVRGTKKSGYETVRAPCMTLEAGTTPSHLGDLFTPKQWQQGLPSRFIYVWGEPTPPRDTYHLTDEPALRNALMRVSDHILTCQRVKWEASALAAMKKWRKSHWRDEPPHPLLPGYARRQHVAITKVALIRCIARCGNAISLTDWRQAAKDFSAIEPGIARCLELAGGNPSRDVEIWIEGQMRARKEATEATVRRWLATRLRAQDAEAVLDSLLSRRIIKAIRGERPFRVFANGKEHTNA